VQVVAADGVIYMVLEYGDIDLARLLAKQESARRTAAGAQPDENFIRLYWQQMLQVRRVGRTRAGCSVHVTALTSSCPLPDCRFPHARTGKCDRLLCAPWTKPAACRAKHLQRSPYPLTSKPSKKL